MQRSDPLAIQLGQIFYYLTVVDIIHIHLCYEEHTRQSVFFTQFPCFLGSYLYA